MSSQVTSWSRKHLWSVYTNRHEALPTVRGSNNRQKQLFINQPAGRKFVLMSHNNSSKLWQTPEWEQNCQPCNNFWQEVSCYFVEFHQKVTHIRIKKSEWLWDTWLNWWMAQIQKANTENFPYSLLFFQVSTSHEKFHCRHQFPQLISQLVILKQASAWLPNGFLLKHEWYHLTRHNFRIFCTTPVTKQNENFNSDLDLKLTLNVKAFG